MKQLHEQIHAHIEISVQVKFPNYATFLIRHSDYSHSSNTEFCKISRDKFRESSVISLSVKQPSVENKISLYTLIHLHFPQQFQDPPPLKIIIFLLILHITFLVEEGIYLASSKFVIDLEHVAKVFRTRLASRIRGSRRKGRPSTPPPPPLPPSSPWNI